MKPKQQRLFNTKAKPEHGRSPSKALVERSDISQIYIYIDLTKIKGNYSVHNLFYESNQTQKHPKHHFT